MGGGVRGERGVKRGEKWVVGVNRVPVTGG